ncbi:protein-export chaperone SecB [Flavobacterium aquicola]|uniref:Preprotein translocase subunit SecB n=1 Tax=Flavobacterium aquicola TaxID=1682742 RepID=A0A3E0EA64_9FLAO|nr:protein-export chaperone SecB [Flavobacterium aquicola]REG94149.1 preprotein translocase subunit SecB [Flavobacterium aquicola]
MINSENAIGFKFSKYKISRFSFNEANNENSDFNISFSPSGLYNENTGEFVLTLAVEAKEVGTDKVVVEAIGIAEYQFDKQYQLAELPSHFFLSAVPIFFPYLRSFVSTLTLQANSNVMILGLINFTNMAEPLKANTKVI